MTALYKIGQGGKPLKEWLKRPILFSFSFLVLCPQTWKSALILILCSHGAQELTPEGSNPAMHCMHKYSTSQEPALRQCHTFIYPDSLFPAWHLNRTNRCSWENAYYSLPESLCLQDPLDVCGTAVSPQINNYVILWVPESANTAVPQGWQRQLFPHGSQGWRFVPRCPRHLQGEGSGMGREGGKEFSPGGDGIWDGDPKLLALGKVANSDLEIRPGGWSCCLVKLWAANGLRTNWGSFWKQQEPQNDHKVDVRITKARQFDS